MNINQLRVFVAIVRKQSLTKVASELNISQPTISFHLKKLEEELGVELFRKHIRHYYLTEVGETLLPYARRIVSLVDEVEQLVFEHQELGVGKLKIGASYTPATYFLPPYLASFQINYPKILPLLTVKKAKEILELLQNYEIDVAVVSLYDEQRPGLETISLIEDELKLLLSPKHRLAGKDKISIKDLENEPFLIHEQGSSSREISEAWAKENRLNWNVRMELGAIEMIKESVKYNMGIGILPKRSVVREVEFGELIMCDLPGYVNHRYISLVYRKEEILAYQVRNFIKFMIEALKNENSNLQPFPINR